MYMRLLYNIYFFWIYHDSIHFQQYLSNLFAIIFRMTDEAFDAFRIMAITVVMCLKIILMPWYLQAYLDMAFHRTEEQKKEAGRITNIDFQKKV